MLAFVDSANNLAVKDMSLDDNSRRIYRKDLLLASAMVLAGLVVTGLSLAEIETGNPQVAQATQPLQSTPGAETKPSAPSAEPTTSGARPTEIPPQPARPDAEAQKAGAPSALPPAPAEKTGAPIKER